MILGAALPHGYRRIAFASAGSTNDEARLLAEAGVRDGLIVTAGLQRAGRGRQGKVWLSPSGNLYASILARPTLPLGRATELVFAAGVAVAEALDPFLPPEAQARCKWPNDILAGGRKLAGILAEAAADSAGRCSHIVIGIGINVADFPTDAAWPATSLEVLGSTATADDVLAAVAGAWDRWYKRWRDDGFAAIRAGWSARAFAVGETIELKQDRAVHRGRFIGLDDNGALVLETIAGQREAHHFGDVSLRLPD